MAPFVSFLTKGATKPHLITPVSLKEKYNDCSSFNLLCVAKEGVESKNAKFIIFFCCLYLCLCAGENLP